jgi:TRAP transporter TAXI family solute receptor
MTVRGRRWLITAIFVVATVAVGLLLSGPSPPRSITLATGQADGMYDTFGARYAARLRRVGLRTDVVRSSGSVDNLHRLLRGEVDVAFVQGGTYPLVDDPDGRVRGIAALYLEPLWVFHRGDASVRSLSDLAGRRMSVGLASSGTEAVAVALLREHGIDPAGPNIVRLANTAARAQLEKGELYAAFLITSYADPMIIGLLARSDVTLLSFDREAVYTRKFPALRPVKLQEGLFDLRRDLPNSDKTLLAPAALLACRADLHPRVVEQVLKVAQAIHSSGSLIDPPLRFPTRDGVDIPLHEAADIYLTQGESFLSRTLPYSLLRWTLLLRVLVVSLILWIPLVRVLPEVVRWRVDRQMSRLYGSLREAEQRLDAARDPGTLRAGLDDLDRLFQKSQPVCDKVPGARQHQIYDWRVHVAFVRARAMERLAALSGSEVSPAVQVDGHDEARS